MFDGDGAIYDQNGYLSIPGVSWAGGVWRYYGEGAGDFAFGNNMWWQASFSKNSETCSSSTSSSPSRSPSASPITTTNVGLVFLQSVRLFEIVSFNFVLDKANWLSVHFAQF